MTGAGDDVLKPAGLLFVCAAIAGCSSEVTPATTAASVPTAVPSSAPSPVAPVAAVAGPVVGPKLTAAPAGVAPGLFDVAAKHNDEPAPEQLTQRLRARAAEVQAACKKAEAEDGGCDDAFYLSCSAGEAQEFWLSGFDGAAAVYSFSVPPREFMRVNYVDQGGWKVDAKSCGGPAHYGEPWAKAQP